ncbi:hypothetical protein PCLA_03r0753 [Pseudomonas citronellolis]|uniref:DUF6162 family protein n=1 Tax=Pseudomonas citronellolis TaxID=53408 RepID=UPI000E2FA90F|nr:DUF6162 family protein [Pseudomonas citronellolis]GBL55404.1 hypothetical protein PCLA_03r0753 [Pseudomonas citronellolis]
MSVQIVRPAGAGHETLYVLLGALLIVLLAATAIALRQERHATTAPVAHQLDARRDLNAAEQGIYADLQVAAEEIQARLAEAGAAPSPAELAAEGFPPFTRDAAAASRGGHAWGLADDAAGLRYLGRSAQAGGIGSFLLLLPAQGEPEVWLSRAQPAPEQAPANAEALVADGWRQVISHFDAGVTRQHRH